MVAVAAALPRAPIAGIGRYHSREALGMLGNQPQADEPAPVLANESHPLQS